MIKRGLFDVYRARSCLFACLGKASQHGFVKRQIRETNAIKRGGGKHEKGWGGANKVPFVVRHLFCFQIAYAVQMSFDFAICICFSAFFRSSFERYVMTNRARLINEVNFVRSPPFLFTSSRKVGGASILCHVGARVSLQFIILS